MKKILILAAAMSLTAGGAALAAPSGWFGYVGHSAGNGHGHAYGRGMGRGNRGDRGGIRCFFRCNGGGNGGGNHGGGGNGEVPSEVPVPAAGFLLLAGLGAFAVAKRRKS